jgi:arabinose-5-phosphate isomerase
MTKIAFMTLQSLLEKQKKYLDFFYAHFDLSSCEKLLDEILECQGVLFFTGVGKSGFIAQKIAATLLSTGTTSFFLSPTDALHGDLGMVSHKDFVFILSKSGETEELLQLLPCIRTKKAKAIAITSNGNSRLVLGSDVKVLLPCEKELCPFDLAPTTSTEIQLLFGDLLAIGLMEQKKITLEQFAENHPAGRIGKRSTLRVRDLMLHHDQTPFCLSDSRLEEVLVDFTNKRCGCLVVADSQKRLQGILTDGDLRRALQAKGENILKEEIGRLMTFNPKSIDEDALAWNAMKLMESDQKNPVMVLPVLNSCHEVVGIIKMHDLIQAGL